MILTHLLLTIFLDITHTRRCDIPYFRLHRERGVDIIRVRSYYQDLTLSDYVDHIFLYLPMHTRTHTRTQTYTRTHTRTHTHTHTHVHAHTHTRTHTPMGRQGKLDSLNFQIIFVKETFGSCSEETKIWRESTYCCHPMRDIIIILL